MNVVNPEQLTGVQKTAILLISLGAETSSLILKRFDEETVESLTKEIIKMRGVHPNVSSAIVSEFASMAKAQEYIHAGGVEYARQVLEKAVGSPKALEIITRVQSTIQLKGFNVLKDIDPNQLLTFIQKEHPQTIALVLSQISRKQASSIVAELPEEIQADVMYRIAQMDQVSL